MSRLVNKWVTLLEQVGLWINVSLSLKICIAICICLFLNSVAAHPLVPKPICLEYPPFCPHQILFAWLILRHLNYLTFFKKFSHHRPYIIFIFSATQVNDANFHIFLQLSYLDHKLFLCSNTFRIAWICNIFCMAQMLFTNPKFTGIENCSQNWANPVGKTTSLTNMKMSITYRGHTSPKAFPKYVCSCWNTLIS